VRASQHPWRADWGRTQPSDRAGRRGRAPRQWQPMSGPFQSATCGHPGGGSDRRAQRIQSR
jgi:hypothetical protein